MSPSSFWLQLSDVVCINMRILHSGLKGQDKGDARNHGFKNPCIFVVFGVPIQGPQQPRVKRAGRNTSWTPSRKSACYGCAKQDIDVFAFPELNAP